MIDETQTEGNAACCPGGYHRCPIQPEPSDTFDHFNHHYPSSNVFVGANTVLAFMELKKKDKQTEVLLLSKDLSPYIHISIYPYISIDHRSATHIATNVLKDPIGY